LCTAGKEDKKIGAYKITSIFIGHPLTYWF